MAGNLERQFGLLQMLLDARIPVRLERIRDGFDDYRDSTDDAFHKMFERDKKALRDLGFVLVASDPMVDDESSYTLDREASLIDDPGLTQEEATALGLALAGARGEGALGAMKLGLAAGIVPPDGWSVAGLEPDARVGVLVDAIARRKRIRFTYRTQRDGDVPREIEPHALTARSGWYLAGHDVARGEARTFRLGRIIGSIVVAKGQDPDFELPSERPSEPQAPWVGHELTAEIAATGNAAWFIERRTRGKAIGGSDDGRVLLEVPFADVGSFASWLAGFGAEAVVREPAELRDAVVAHLRSVL